VEKQVSSKPRLKFTDKTVVITGSGTGIGQAIARKFAENGAHIVIMGRRKEPLDQTAGILEQIIASSGSSGRLSVFPGVDVADEAGINSMFASIRKEFGGADIIVNNAGVSGPVKTFTNASVKEFRETIAIHLTGTYWTSVSGLGAMKKGAKIITIATFFTEENRYEQRPYRFRTPYTAAQGAKNRLAEALAWELVERDIRSIATNPGPVHSDRIYKTVYPKAAAEFLRIGGYPGLSSLEIEKVTAGALPLLGEPTAVVAKGVSQVAAEILNSRDQESSDEDVQNLSETVAGALAKMQEIAEKIQSNTSKMIVDGQFLKQEEVADMVMNLCDDDISRLINGRVIPNDRVFYPVKPIVGTAVSDTVQPDVKGKVIVITTSSSAKKDIERVREIATLAHEREAKDVIVLAHNHQDMTEYGEFHSHTIDMLDEKSVRGLLNAAKRRSGKIDSIIHFTGEYDYNLPLSSLSRKQWDAPIGKKISGLLRARADVFRGALRPYTTTVNQELGDVLGSSIKLHLVLAGNSEGSEPDNSRLYNSVLNLAAGVALKRNEAIFYIDEATK
jgi:NAD(P)-dependent dehydrogenase (short-subunit alcohol dehydrogenase family)